MGRNFILNIAEKGYSALGFDLDVEKVEALNVEAKDFSVKGVNSLQTFIDELNVPRKIMMLVPADAVDSVIKDLIPLLESGDLIVDCGNSHPENTRRREREVVKKGYKYLGVGISGGSEGARHGPNMMPGGDEKSYQLVKAVFEAVAARVNDEPCATWLGPGAAGHFVKMVHNGIEYGIMQLISEAYDLMKNGLGMNNPEMKSTFEKWNQGHLSSYLIEITADILGKEDEEKNGYLIDHILDSARQKGTGKWTSQLAMDLGVPLPTVDAAVSMRYISAFKKEREMADLVIRDPKSQIREEKTKFLLELENSLYLSMMLTYAQGFEFLRIASDSWKFGLKLSDVARIWRGGCIIRSALLDDFMLTYKKYPRLQNLLLDNQFSSIVNQKQSQLLQVVIRGTESGIPIMAFMSVLSYLDAYSSGHLAANMIQAQRDYFGSHKYQKVGEEGEFHTDW